MRERPGTIMAGTPIGSRARRRKDTKPCPCGCGQLGFCEAHRARLQAIAEQLHDERKGRARNAAGTLRAPQRRIDKRGGSPTCCNPHCYEPRIPPAAYCDTCQADGFVEEEDA